MEIGSIESSAAAISEYGLKAEHLQASKTPADITGARAVYKETQESFEQVAGSANPPDQDIEKLVGQFNKLVDAFNVQLKFTFSKDSPNHIKVKVVNTQTNEVIREIPPEKFSFIGSKVLDAVGLIVDQLA